MKTLVLDAMGVIYSVGDDVADLLCPFIEEKGGLCDRSLTTLYRAASSGQISAKEFWLSVHVDPALEGEYLERHRLSDGLIEFLRAVIPRVSSIWCLSNDVSEWSRKLRERFGLTQYIRGFVISDDVGARKPDRAIFDRLLNAVAAEPKDIVLVDDRLRNLDPAAALGFETVLFAVGGSYGPGKHWVARNFQELLDLVSQASGGKTGSV